jgi:diacylglycerol kinase
MKKFADAFHGLSLVLRHKAVRIQFLLAILALIGGTVIRLTYGEWLAFLVMITMVLTAEVFNTAIERIGDALNGQYDQRIREIKDISAAAVLLSSMGALAVCLIALIRRLL